MRPSFYNWLVDRRWALLWVALGASLWGTDTVLRRPLTSSLSSPQIVLIEHLILTLALLPVCWRARAQWRALEPSQWGAVLGVSWGGSAVGTVLFTEAIRMGNPSTAVLLQKTQPLFAALLARHLLGEQLGRRFWISLLLALWGAYLVSFGAQNPFRFRPPVPAAAALLALAAAALWGASTVLGRWALERLSFLTLTALRIVVATPLLLILAWIHSSSMAMVVGAGQALALLVLALVPGLLALIVYYRGLRHARASRAAIAELSFPAVATLLNWAVLGARISAVQLTGFALLWGVILNLEKGKYAESGH
jgi:drug/metabolite transporter (DMT)-like permease